MDIETADENINNNDNNSPIIEMPVSPKPGFSKDFDLLENSQTMETELHKQVIEIHEFLVNITYNKIRELIKKKENFKRDLFELFGDESLKRGGDGDIFDVERKKLILQITSVDGPIKMEDSKKKVPVPEALLDVPAGINEKAQKLTPPLRGTKRATDAKNPIPISLDSSIDDGVVFISKKSADGEPVSKIKKISHGETSDAVSADNLPEQPLVHGPAPNNEPLEAHEEHHHDRWNPVFHQPDNSNNRANDKNLNQAIIDAQLRKNLALRLSEEADRRMAESLNAEYQKELRDYEEAHDLPNFQQPELQLPAKNAEDLPPRPDHDPLPPINRPKIPIVDGNEAQLQLQAPAKVEDGYCHEIYTKLRAIFPNIKNDYIKKMIPPDWTPNVIHDVEFGQIVERLLAAETTWELEVPENEPADLIGAVGGAAANENPRTIDETYEYLLELFPRADPTYLRTHAERIYNNDQAFEGFIEQTLKKHDYPTREQYMSQMRITEERLRYTDNFTVQSFLEKFPDPFGHFLDNKRKCGHNVVVNEFLKSHFNRIRANTISKIYRESAWNMSIAASKLAKIGSDMNSTRRSHDMPPKDMNLLQEIAFVRHQQALKDHIAQMEKAEKLEFEELKKSNGLLECECCYDNECMPSKCSTCDNGHIFCNSCIITGTDAKLGENETHVACFQSCGSEFSLATLQKIMKPTKFSILVKKRQAAEVVAAELEGLVACPFCHFATIPPDGDKVFKCLNPECMKESCIQCKEPNHVPLHCDEVDKADKARKYIEEKMTEALARSCYKCKRPYFKVEGCNKIKCPCGAIMCYICNKKIDGYDHFQGQGPNNSSKCPMSSNNASLNAENVRRAADETRRELLSQNPALNIDTERLLPNLPTPLARPHQQILQAAPRLPVPTFLIGGNNPRPAAQGPGYHHQRQQMLQAPPRLPVPNFLIQGNNPRPAAQGPRHHHQRPHYN